MRTIGPSLQLFKWNIAVVASGLLLAGSAAAEGPAEGPYLSNIRQVTSQFTKAGEGYFAPDGRSIVFQAIPPGYPFYQIYRQDLEDAVPRRISTGRGRTTCSYYAPDGKRILYASSHLDPDLLSTEAAAYQQEIEDRRSGSRRRYNWVFDPHMDLFTTDPDGRNLRRLTGEPGYDAECAYSPDGSKIAFCSDRDGDPDLYLMNSDGTGVVQLTDQPGYDGGPFISPDGRWIVYRTDRGRESGELQIHAMQIDGSNDVALTDNVGTNWAPYWHPTEPYIIWSGADHSDPTKRPNYDLWMVRFKVVDGKLSADGPIQRVTEHPAADVLPVFSPDGKRLMWTSTRTDDRSSQLWIADFKLPQ